MTSRIPPSGGASQDDASLEALLTGAGDPADR
jgi:hypothetical protein